MSNSINKQKLKQKYKARKQRNKRHMPWLWPLVAIGGVIALVAAFFVYSNRDGGGTPVIAVDQKLIDYGDVHFDQPKTFAVTITNTGEGTLRFKGEPYIEVVEGC